MRFLCVVVIFILSGAADEAAPADLGGPAPTLIGVQWLRGGKDRAETSATSSPVRVVMFWATDPGLDQTGIDFLKIIGQQAQIIVLADVDDAPAQQLATREDAPADQGVADGAVRARWLGSEESPLPAAAIVGVDGILLWRGKPDGILVALARETAMGFDRVQLRAVAALRAEMRLLLEAQPEAGDGRFEAALGITARILAAEPMDEEAIRLRLDISRHLDKRDEFRATLADLSFALLSADLANQFAWERLIDEDLAWRHLDLAVKLAEHACGQQPDVAEHQDTFARALYLLGLVEDALAVQIKAVSLSPEDEQLAATLDYYREVIALRNERTKARALPP